VGYALSHAGQPYLVCKNADGDAPIDLDDISLPEGKNRAD
jgi:hypothetical protein